MQVGAILHQHQFGRPGKGEVPYEELEILEKGELELFRKKKFWNKKLGFPSQGVPLQKIERNGYLTPDTYVTWILIWIFGGSVKGTVPRISNSEQPNPCPQKTILLDQLQKGK